MKSLQLISLSQQKNSVRFHECESELGKLGFGSEMWKIYDFDNPKHYFPNRINAQYKVAAVRIHMVWTKY